MLSQLILLNDMAVSHFLRLSEPSTLSGTYPDSSSSLSSPSYPQDALFITDVVSKQEHAKYDYEALAVAFAQAQQREMHVANPYSLDGKDVDQSSTAIAAVMMGVVPAKGSWNPKKISLFSNMLTMPVEAVQKLQVTMENVEKALRLRQHQAARVAKIQKVQVAVLSHGLGILVQEFNGWLVDTERCAEATAPLNDKDLEYRDFRGQLRTWGLQKADWMWVPWRTGLKKRKKRRKKKERMKRTEG
ncbi:hypothetical protein NP233_g8995 [Leucocoprinus birnbaumii]|uniref:Uncharacterized protein n=1 Tax=Leucocoprinus birnbaumii TaxID=56174 RepID=A0AAD5YNK2_9AGAR|nr:hypothetical protein NP233_g8995 [Leucocoprinus birnbaumii]